MGRGSISNRSDMAVTVMLLLAVGTMLGTSVIVAKSAAIVGWPPLALLQWAMLGSALIQMTANALKARALLLPRPAIGYGAISGLLFAVPNALAFAAAQHVGAGFVALCFAFPLVLTYGMAIGLGMERLERARLAGVLCGVAGAAALVIDSRAPGGQISVWALAAVAVPFVISIGNIYRSVYWPVGVHPLQLSAAMMAFGALTMAVVNAAMGTSMGPDRWSPSAISLMAFQILIFAALYGLYFRLQDRAGPVYLSQIGSVAAVTGVGLAFAVFGEVPTILEGVAALLVVFGVLSVSRQAGARHGPDEAPPRPESLASGNCSR